MRYEITRMTRIASEWDFPAPTTRRVRRTGILIDLPDEFRDGDRVRVTIIVEKI